MNYWELSSYIQEKHAACPYISDGVTEEIEIKNHIPIPAESYAIQSIMLTLSWKQILVFFLRTVTNSHRSEFLQFRMYNTGVYKPHKRNKQPIWNV